MRDLLRSMGIDIEARLAAGKMAVEAKAQHVADVIRGEAQSFALRVGFWCVAGLMGFCVLLVGMLLIYAALEPSYGPVVALGVVLGLFCVLALACVIIAVALGRGRPLPPHILFPPVVFSDLPNEGPIPEVQPAATHPTASAFLREIVLPLVAFVGRYRPLTGHWGVDGVIRQAASRAPVTAQEAVGRAAELVRSGSRSTLYGVLGTALVIGWLLARRRGPRASG